MFWRIGPDRECTELADDIAYEWYRILSNEAADANARYRLDAYIESVNMPITIANTFINEWLEGLWLPNPK